MPGTALDAGCGEGAEALWLASRGWHVTAADIAAEALARAASRAAAQTPASGLVRWVEADLTTWAPETQFDLVTTNYAHPAMPQLAFYQRIAEWVAPGGTLCLYAPPAPDGPALLDGTTLFLRELTVTASYSAGPGDMRAALELIASGQIDPLPLITHRLPLERTQEALELQRSGQGLKVVVVP